MPRKARVDALGALQHVICRGIEHRKIFIDTANKNNFVARLGDVVRLFNGYKGFWVQRFRGSGFLTSRLKEPLLKHSALKAQRS
jgi:hypothetical protein